jgi:hypothetical protein
MSGSYNSRQFCSAPLLVSAIFACLFAVSLPTTANAQVYVYAQPPPPPPPPPPPGYYYYYRRPYIVEPPVAVVIAADGEGAVPLNVPRFISGNDLQDGGGFKIRLGVKMKLPGGPVSLTPEVGFGYEQLFATDYYGYYTSYDWNMERAFAGARLAFGRFVMPVVYAHAGYGWRYTGDPTVPASGGFTFDVGGAIDFRLSPHFVFGGHMEFVSIDATPYAPEWLAFGIHAQALLF